MASGALNANSAENSRIKVFSHFVITRENCEVIENVEFKYKEALEDYDFKELVFSVDLEHLEAAVEKYLNELQQKEVEKLESIFKIKKQKVLDALKNDEFKSSMILKYSHNKFENLYVNDLK